MALSEAEAAKAARYNGRNAGQIGWPAQWTQVAALLEVGDRSVTPEHFAQLVATWQGRTAPLTDDGMLGNLSWARMQPELRFSTAPRPRPSWLPAGPPAPSIAPILVPAGDAPWLQVAEQQKDRWDDATTGWTAAKRNRAEQHFDWDEEYFAAAPYWGGRVHPVGERPSTNRNPHWCAAFVNYCLHRAGYSHTGSAGAASFVGRGRWRFRALTSPRKGCVAVMGGTTGQHVAFLWNFSGLPDNPGGNVANGPGVTIQLLGGNQSNRVKISTDGRNMIAATDSRGVRSPYLWPEIGEATCNHDVPTARPHHCGHRH